MIGRALGHYHIVERIGAGGMGEVYRATDTRLGRDVAIKVLPQAFSDDPARQARFEREARVLASLNHPNIAAIYEFGAIDGIQFLVLELVKGVSLADRRMAGVMPVAEALRVCRDIAIGLEAAHESGILHRDLKPANIMLTAEGTVKLLDFGLAKALADESPAQDGSRSPTLTTPLTRRGVRLGSAGYMSPEQARGRSVDKRTDIWAFGCVLYEVLSGRQAFPGESDSDSIALILKGEPAWDALPVSTPAGIKSLLRRCLQKDAGGRLRDIGDARIEIEESLNGDSSPSGPTVAPAAGWRRAILWCAAGLLVGGLAGAAAIRQLGPAPPKRPLMRFSAVTNFAGVEAQPSLSPDGRSVAFVSNRDGRYDIYVGLVSGGSLVRVTSDPNLEARPRWSPDGAKIAYARLNDSGFFDIWIVPALGGTPRRILTGASDPSWSPDGGTLAYMNIADRFIWLADSNGGNRRPITKKPLDPFIYHNQPAFSRDGRRIAFLRRGDGPYAELAIADLGSGTIRQLTDDGASALSPAWSSDDRFIYFGSSRGGAVNIWRMPVQGGEPEQLTAGQGEDAELDLSADGRRIVFSSYRTNTNIAELPVGSQDRQLALKWLTTDSARGESGPAYSPDGRRIAYFSNRRGAENETIWSMDADGAHPTQLLDDRQVNIFPRWSADGRMVFFTSRPSGPGASRFWTSRKLWKVGVSGGLPEDLHIEVSEPFWGDVGRDDRVLFRGPNGEARVFDPKTGRTETLQGVRGSILRWSPDGRRVAYAVNPRQENDPDAGVWIRGFDGSPRQIFRGWVVWYAWVSPEELFVAEGKPDLRGVLWRVRPEGPAPQPVLAPIPLEYYHWSPNPTRFWFDANPDGRRIIAAISEFREADIGMLENIH